MWPLRIAASVVGVAIVGTIVFLSVKDGSKTELASDQKNKTSTDTLSLAKTDTLGATIKILMVVTKIRRLKSGISDTTLYQEIHTNPQRLVRPGERTGQRYFAIGKLKKLLLELIKFSINGTILQFPLSFPDKETVNSPHILWTGPVAQPITWQGGTVPFTTFSKSNLEASSAEVDFTNWAIIHCGHF